MKQHEKSIVEWLYVFWLVIGVILGFFWAQKLYSQPLTRAQNDASDISQTLDSCEKAVCTLNKDTIELTQVANTCLSKLQELTGKYVPQLTMPEDVCNKLG